MEENADGNFDDDNRCHSSNHNHRRSDGWFDCSFDCTSKQVTHEGAFTSTLMTFRKGRIRSLT